MLKSLLLGLDGSENNRAVVDLGLRWAGRFRALAVGVAVVDEPGIVTSEAVLFAGGGPRPSAGVTASLQDYAYRRAHRILERFATRCGEARVRFRTLEEIGSPYVRLLKESQRFDIVLLGRETHFAFGSGEESDSTLAQVLQDCPRPVVAVPEAIGEGEGPIVAAYDGSIPAARALYAFAAAGLGRRKTVRLVGVDREARVAARPLDRAAEFLRSHGVEVVPRAIETASTPAEVILDEARASGAGLLVMGAYGQPVLREFFLGSVTRTVLASSPVPVLCCH